MPGVMIPASSTKARTDEVDTDREPIPCAIGSERTTMSRGIVGDLPTSRDPVPLNSGRSAAAPPAIFPGGCAKLIAVTIATKGCDLRLERLARRLAQCRLGMGFAALIGK